MIWAVTDRVTRLNFALTLVLAGAGVAMILSGRESLLLVAGVLILVYRAWQLAVSKQVRVEIDGHGITKQVGQRRTQLAWSQLSAARLTRFLGAPQVVFTHTADLSWSSSDRLYFLAPRGSLAVQVPLSLLPQLRTILTQHDLSLAE